MVEGRGTETPVAAPRSLLAIVECPRCGHRLSGNAEAAIARGEDAVRCPECGISLGFADLATFAAAPRWFVESPFRKRLSVRRLFATLVVCAHPFHFWSRVGLALPLRRGALIAFVVLVATALHLVAFAFRCESLSRQAPPASMLAGRAAPSVSWDYALAFLAPTSAYRGSNVVLFVEEFEVPDTAWRTVTSIGRRFVALALVPNPSEIEFLAGANNPHAAPAGTRILLRANDARPVGSSQLVSTFGAIAVPVLAPLVMTLLPTTLRRARVRRRHFVRICVYASAVAIPLFAISLQFRAPGNRFMLEPYPVIPGIHANGSQGMVPNAHLVLVATAGLLATLWCAAAARRYLRLEHAFSVGAACGLVAALLALVTTAIVGDLLGV